MAHRHILFGTTLMLFVAASTSANAKGTEKPNSELEKITAGRTVGEPVDCIQLNRIRKTQIVPQTAIVYEMDDGRLMVNRPSTGRLFLRPGVGTITDTGSPYLCSIDVLQLFDNTAGSNMGFVGLSKFIPWSQREKPDRSSD